MDEAERAQRLEQVRRDIEELIERQTGARCESREPTIGNVLDVLADLVRALTGR